MNESQFLALKIKASTFKYTSLNYTSFENVCEYEILLDDCDIVLLYGYDEESNYFQYLWACNNVEIFIEAISNKKDDVMIQFIPEAWVLSLKNVTFELYAIWNDYINSDITNVNYDKKPEFLTEKDCLEAAILTQSCRGQSRGFSGQTEQWMKEWLNGTEPSAVDGGSTDFAVLIHRENGDIVGVICTAIYAHDSTKGPICWIREVAVAKEFQNRGIAQKLINEALAYGKNHSATRAFLMADECNENAIHLYNKLGFTSDKSERQIDMIKIY
ncbi:MAG: GNAT family N-acetyltransferase [Clostridium sp.]|uniref:GNAT family N-acetyltransferase n=1 Tax=Clostridium sp. TaxID=1506 RepID=UPI002A8DA59D|nr:GNAT family N-acetyltransferase [Clostridium sp.]MDY5098813.1 GNAT family N-acetyltransferase [Clostridium sp.]